jgi:hypothetical protein
MTTKYHYSRADVDTTLAYLRAHQPATRNAVVKATAMSEWRAGDLLRLICDKTAATGTARAKGAMDVWTLKPDGPAIAEALVAINAARPRPGTYLRATAVRRKQPARANAPADTYPRGDAHYFPTDGMGRIIGYTGPARVDDARWALDDEDAA